ncbi:Hypothetical protein GbCGDNIH7_5073 [Granulibacter bethesdensis]|nr:Hypothetical protein GbCGDNIH7_5073 [Granulibacter bethesdensis]
MMVSYFIHFLPLHIICGGFIFYLIIKNNFQTLIFVMCDADERIKLFSHSPATCTCKKIPGRFMDSE